MNSESSFPDGDTGETNAASAYRRAADHMVSRHPVASYAPRFAVWSLRVLVGRGSRIGGLSLAWAVILVVAALTQPDWREAIVWIAIVSLAGLIVFLGAAYLKFLLQRVLARQSEAAAAQASEIARLDVALEEARRERGAIEHALNAAPAEIAQLRQELDALSARSREDAARGGEAYRLAESTRQAIRRATQRLDQRILDLQAEVVRRDELAGRESEERIGEKAAGLREDYAAADARGDAALRSRLQALETKLQSEIRRLENQSEQRGANEAGLIESLEETAVALQAKLAALPQEMNEKIDDRLAPLSRELGKQNKMIVRSNAANAARARVHDRLLSWTDLNQMLESWGPKLGLDLTQKQLSYLAHKICMMEDRADGRLATAIQTAVFRLILLQSLKRRDVEVLEIGALFGLGAAALHRLGGEDLGGISLTVIDPLDGYYGKGAKDPYTGAVVSEETLRKNFKTLGVPKKQYRIIKRFSEDGKAIKEAADRQYDFLLIDGDHSFDGVKRDFETYGPMVRQGGLVLFDDYDTAEWPDIADYVDQHVRGLEGWEWLGGAWRTGALRRTGEPETPV